MNIYRNVGGFMLGRHHASGRSTPDGFFLMVTRTHPDGSEFTYQFKTRHIDPVEITLREFYQTQTQNRDAMMIGLSYGYAWLAVILFLISLGFPSTLGHALRIIPAYWCTFFFPSSCMHVIAYILAFYRIWTQGELVRWHGCEHKTAELIEKELPINLENLRAQPIVNIRCGTILIHALQLYYTTYRWICLLGIAMSAYWLTLWPLLIVALALWPMTQYYHFCREAPAGKPISLIARERKALFFLPLLMERICAVREPTEEMLKETIEDLLDLRSYQTISRTYPSPTAP